MRILANYGYKANGDMYSVTFETMGDVPSTQAPQTVDELFRFAKEAVHRQLAEGSHKPAAQPATPVTVPQPALIRVPAAVNGDGRKPRPRIKNPDLPATPGQIGLLKRLAHEKGQWVDDLTDLTMGEASIKIGQLLAAA